MCKPPRRGRLVQWQCLEASSHTTASILSFGRAVTLCTAGPSSSGVDGEAKLRPATTLGRLCAQRRSHASRPFRSTYTRPRPRATSHTTATASAHAPATSCTTRVGRNLNRWLTRLRLATAIASVRAIARPRLVSAAAASAAMVTARCSKSPASSSRRSPVSIPSNCKRQARPRPRVWISRLRALRGLVASGWGGGLVFNRGLSRHTNCPFRAPRDRNGHAGRIPWDQWPLSPGNATFRGLRTGVCNWQSAPDSLYTSATGNRPCSTSECAPQDTTRGSREGGAARVSGREPQGMRLPPGLHLLSDIDSTSSVMA